MLPSDQDELLRLLSKVNPNIVTVLVSGGPNDLTVTDKVSKALLISWFNGSEGGNALADVLIGNISPSGRLPFTLPLKLEDSPAYSLGNYKSDKKSADIFANLVKESEKDSKTGKKENETVESGDPNLAIYSEGSLVGYRWYDTKKIPVMYPFGYGLTYTTFEYSALQTNKNKFESKDVISVSFKLKNSGKMKADEVVQVYVHRINPSVKWPEKELKAFSRITLEPAGITTVKLEIPIKSLRYWNESAQSWKDDPCNIEIKVGASVDDIKLTKMISVK